MPYFAPRALPLATELPLSPYVQPALALAPNPLLGIPVTSTYNPPVAPMPAAVVATPTQTAPTAPEPGPLDIVGSQASVAPQIPTLAPTAVMTSGSPTGPAVAPATQDVVIDGNTYTQTLEPSIAPNGQRLPAGTLIAKSSLSTLAVWGAGAYLLWRILR